jgi:UDP-glucuronate decarboxylase
VDDLVEGLTRMLCREDLASEIINLGTDREMTILALAERIKELTGSASGFAFRTLPEDDPLKRQPDLTKARSLLGWEPLVPLEEGLQRLVDWFVRVPDRG